MRARRPLALTLLFLTAIALPNNPAPAQSPQGDKDIPAPRRVVDPKDVDDLKKALADLKAKTDADAKSLTAKLDEATKAAGAAADNKAMGERSAQLRPAPRIPPRRRRTRPPRPARR
jgi:hypothetical protein